MRHSRENGIGNQSLLKSTILSGMVYTMTFVKSLDSCWSLSRT